MKVLSVREQTLHCIHVCRRVCVGWGQCEVVRENVGASAEDKNRNGEKEK